MTGHQEDQRWSGTEVEERPWENMKPTMEYNGRHDGCQLCDGDEFSAGFIEFRIRTEYGNGWGEHDYQGLCDELAREFDIEVSVEELTEHDKFHVSTRMK